MMYTNLPFYGPFFIRIGLAAVFLLFGAQKMYAASQGSAEIQLILSTSFYEVPFQLASLLNFGIGIVELALAAMLFLGWYTRLAAAAGTALIVVIFMSIIAKYGLNFDPTISRDLGLIGASAGLWFLGGGKWSIDNKRTA
ncbi:MAG: DoxX family protein [Patescibacteria group bacterium]